MTEQELFKKIWKIAGHDDEHSELAKLWDGNRDHQKFVLTLRKLSNTKTRC